MKVITFIAILLCAPLYALAQGMTIISGDTAAPAAGLAFDLANCGTGHTLSDADLTDTAPGSDTNCQSTTSKSSGKHYFRILTTFSSSDYGARWGIVGSGTGTNIALGSDTSSIMCPPSSPEVPPDFYFNGAVTGSWCDSGAFASGSTQEVNVDIDNGTIWARTCCSGNWNNDVAADPATNTGGQVMGITCPCKIAVGSGSGVTGGTFTLVPNTGTLLSGYSYW